MTRTAKIGVVVALLIVVGIVLATKQRAPSPNPHAAPPGAASATEPSADPGEAAGTPRLLELGSVTCIPCKMMAPILEQLREEYTGKLEVVFIDVWQDPDAGTPYNIRVIPTQILFDASGTELFRHEGFFAKEDILAKWEELGVDLKGDGSAAFERLEPAQPDRRSDGAVSLRVLQEQGLSGRCAEPRRAGRDELPRYRQAEHTRHLSTA